MSRVYVREANGQFAAVGGASSNPYSKKTPRAYKAQAARLRNKTQKLVRENASLTQRLKKAIAKKDFDLYTSLKAQETELRNHIAEAEAKLSYVNRCYDTTDEGRKALQRSIDAATGRKKEMLKVRQRQADTLEFARLEAERLYANDFTPLLRVA